MNKIKEKSAEEKRIRKTVKKFSEIWIADVNLMTLTDWLIDGRDQ